MPFAPSRERVFVGNRTYGRPDLSAAVSGLRGVVVHGGSHTAFGGD